MTDLRGLVGALRDLKFMLERPSEDDRIAEFVRNRFYINAHDDATTLLEPALISHNDPSLNGATYLHISDYTGFEGINWHNDWKKRRDLAWYLRLQIAIFGGLALIIPMLIMRLHPTLLTQLLTASLFILCFGITIAYVLHDSEAIAIATISAGYAAVLVVFVGSSGSAM
jgi:uncharacterized membrane protein YhaH (DUF805 family)